MYGRYTSEQLKKLAMGTMFIDHAAMVLIYNHGLNEMSPLLENTGLAMRLVGRMAFPLYAFLLVQGFLHTKNWAKYAARAAVFAVVSEIPFNLAAGGSLWYPAAQNTMMTMAVGLVCMKALSLAEDFGQRTGSSRWIGAGTGNTSLLTPSGRKWAVKIWSFFIVSACMGIAQILRTDYGASGILLILVFYYFRYRPSERMALGCAVLVLMYFNVFAFAAWIAFFFINRYNGERGQKLGYMPYLFYPAHLITLYLAGCLITAV